MRRVRRASTSCGVFGQLAQHEGLVPAEGVLAPQDQSGAGDEFHQPQNEFVYNDDPGDAELCLQATFDRGVLMDVP